MVPTVQIPLSIYRTNPSSGYRHPTLQFPVKGHVRKYLISKHGTDLKLSRRHKEGKMLIHMLRNPQDDRRFDAQLEKYTDTLTVRLSFDQLYFRGCNNISSRTIHDFNDFIDALIKDEFIYYVETLLEVGIKLTLDQMVDGFMGKYNFDEDDITPFVLKQTYYRRKRKKNS